MEEESIFFRNAFWKVTRVEGECFFEVVFGLDGGDLLITSEDLILRHIRGRAFTPLGVQLNLLVFMV